MFEILFILGVIFVAYIGYTKTGDDEPVKKPDIPIHVELKAEIPKKPPAKAQKVVVKNKSKVSKADTGKAKVSKTAAPKIELRTVEMKNPKTGEQAKVANNYRMVKRWVKEALVEEGLLEKIYKTNEMDDTAKATVANALSIIKAMDKYKV